MTTENHGNKQTKNRIPLLYTSLALLVVAIYVVWTLLSRQIANRAYERRIESEQAQKQRQSDRAAVEQLGGSELAIQMLYATPEIRRGQTAQVCFGVSNAKWVKLEPQDHPVWPSHNLCVDVNPNKTTTYTLTATAVDGKSVTQQVSVKVR